MMASAQVVKTPINTNNRPSQDYTTNPDNHSNHNIDVSKGEGGGGGGFAEKRQIDVSCGTNRYVRLP